MEYSIHWTGEDSLEIEDEQGVRHAFSLALIFPVAGNDYAILYPRDDDTDEIDEYIDDKSNIVRPLADEDDDGGYLILKVDEENDDLIEIEDEREFELVLEAWQQIVEETEAGLEIERKLEQDRNN